jgi:glycosyltransferase involved in cell wall biosynthesis
MDQKNYANGTKKNTVNTRLAAIIPALNESKNIELVVRLACSRAQAIVIDDGSSDDTAERARRAGAYVVIHRFNKGYDAALETGIRTAIDQGFIYAVTIDADGQHDPSLLDRFGEELEAGAHMVIGERDFTQRWSETIFSRVSRHLWKVNDPLCGMKGYNLRILSNTKKINTYDSIGTELIIRGIKAGLKIKQIPVHTSPREGDSRFGSGINANLKIIKSLIYGLYSAEKLLLPEEL